MKVHGFEITPEHIAAGNAAMAGAFTCADITQALIAAGVPEYTSPRVWRDPVAYRAAGRLIDAAKRTGAIKLNGRTWHRVTP